MCHKIILLLLLSNYLVITQSARILVHCPMPSFSHQAIYRPIIKELSLRGHQVTSITPEPLNDPKLVNLTEINVSFTYGMKSQFNFADKSDLGIGQTNFIMNVMKSIVWDVYDPQLSNPQVKKIIQDPNEYFDLVIVEWYPSASLAFSERFNCPLVGITSLGLSLASHVAIGNSVNPSYYVDLLLPFSDSNTFIRRLSTSLFNLWYFNFMNTVMYPEQNKVTRKHFGDNISSIEVLEKRVSVVLTNSHPVIYGARPTVPAVVDIAGIYKKSKNTLPQDIKEYLDNATHGAIYFSFGSNVKGNSVSKEKREIFIETFKSLPYRVLWKFESDELPGKPDNVKISKWFPQSDVLYHPNVKLFITQGGLQSWEEAIHGHVPLIGFPFIGDQFWNVDRMENLGIGIKMNIDNFNKHSLTKAIHMIINNATYHDNIKKMSALLDDQPMKPLDTAIFWIEYALRHGNTTIFQSPTMTIPWHQYFLIDVIVFLVICITFSMFISYILIRKTIIFLLFCCQESKQKMH